MRVAYGDRFGVLGEVMEGVLEAPGEHLRSLGSLGGIPRWSLGVAGGPWGGLGAP